MDKNYITVKFAMRSGCFELNEELLARLKIGLTAKHTKTPETAKATGPQSQFAFL